MRPSNPVICLPAPCITIALLGVCQRRRPSECHTNYKVCIGGGFCPQNWLQRPLRDRNITRSFILRPKFYQSCQFREDLSVRWWHRPSCAARGGGRNWFHKKIPGCAVELNTQSCAWFGSQISLITAMSFREAMPPNHPPGALPLDPA